MTPLFGGALTASLPPSFTDVSTLRQVPDNQEVFVQSTGLSSISVDLLARVAPPEHDVHSDEDALAVHVDDLLEGSAGERRDAGRGMCGIGYVIACSSCEGCLLTV